MELTEGRKLGQRNIWAGIRAVQLIAKPALGRGDEDRVFRVWF
jgi:hypothetical protein